MKNLNVKELKAARALLKEALNSKAIYWFGADEKPAVEIVVKAIGNIEAWGDWAQDYYQMKLSVFDSYAAVSTARGIASNGGYFETKFAEGDYVNVVTTHDLSYVSFTRGAIETVAVELLKRVFNFSNDLGFDYSANHLDSCRELAGSKYRPSNRKLAYKVYKIVVEHF